MKPKHFVKQGFTLIELLVVVAIIALLATILFPVFSRVRENARRSSCASNLKQIGLGIMQYTQDYDEIYPRSDNATTEFNGVVADTPDLTSIWQDMYFPGNVEPYTKSRQIMQCPSTRITPSLINSYWAVGGFFGRRNNRGDIAGVPMSAFPSPVTSPMVYDALEPNAINKMRFRPFWYAKYSATAAVGSHTGNIYYRHFKSYYPTATARHLDTVNVLYGDGHVKTQPLPKLFEQACPDAEYSSTVTGECSSAPTPPLPN